MRKGIASVRSCALARASVAGGWRSSIEAKVAVSSYKIRAGVGTRGDAHDRARIEERVDGTPADARSSKNPAGKDRPIQFRWQFQHFTRFGDELHTHKLYL